MSKATSAPPATSAAPPIGKSAGDILKTVLVTKDFPVRKSLVVTSSDETVSSALKKLIDANVLSLPVVDREKFVGIIDMIDVVQLITDYHWDLVGFPNIYLRANLWSKWNDSFVDRLLALHHYKFPKHASAYVSDAPSTTLFDVVALMAKGHHRVPVLSASTPGKIVNMITQSAVVAFLAAKVAASAAVSGASASSAAAFLPATCLSRKVSDFKSQTGSSPSSSSSPSSASPPPPPEIHRVHASAKAIQAFRFMATTRVSAVPIVDDADALLGTISVHDIRQVAYDCDKLKDLYEKTSVDFAKMVNGRADNHAETLAIAVEPFATLRDVLLLLDKNKIHRVWVVNAKKQVTGVVALKDIFEELML